MDGNGGYGSVALKADDAAPIHDKKQYAKDNPVPRKHSKRTARYKRQKSFDDKKGRHARHKEADRK
jgi:hypothetical protein